MSRTEKGREIMAAALELLAEQGFHGAPMAQIASHAGVATGTIYCHFASRDDLIRELLCDIEKRITAQIQGCEFERLSIRDRFRHICRSLLDYFTAHPLEFRYVEQFHNSPYGVEHRREMLFGEGSESQFCRDLFNQGVAEGVIKDLTLVILYALTFGPILAVARDHILGFVTLDQVLCDRIVDACWDAVKC